MRSYDLGGLSPFRYVIYGGVKPHDPGLFQEALKELSTIPKVSVQILRADRVAGEEHIITSSILSARAWNKNRGIAHTPATEILLYASGKRQIKDAIATMGVGAERGERFGWVIVAVSDSPSALEALGAALKRIGEENDGLMELSDEKVRPLMETFGIGREELSIAEKLASSRVSALKSLVMERVALSEVYR